MRGGQHKWRGVTDVFVIALKLGLTSFGGPVAHIGYFREEYVKRRKWLDEGTFGELLAISQFLPGPSSSQLGMAIGMKRAGAFGGAAAWLGFTLPSAILMLLFAQADQHTGWMDAGWVHGLKLAAVAIIAHAVWGMARQFVPDRRRASIALAAVVWTLLIPLAAGQLLMIGIASAAGMLFLRKEVSDIRPAPFEFQIKRSAALVSLLVFAILFVSLPVLRLLYPGPVASVVDSFYRVGSLVFGGGHVVLPMLQQEIVNTGWLSPDQFLAGYGAAQAIPGPMFTFAAYAGAAMETGWLGIGLGILAVAAVFAPSYLMMLGLLPFWPAIRARPVVQAALRGVNAAVVGMLLAALYNPAWIGTVSTPGDFAAVLTVFAMLAVWRLPPWLTVAAAAVLGFATNH